MIVTNFEHLLWDSPWVGYSIYIIFKYCWCLNICSVNFKAPCYLLLPRFFSSHHFHPFESSRNTECLKGTGQSLFSQEAPSVQFSCSVVSNSLWPHESQHARPSCLSPTPGVHSNSCPLSQWCHSAISSSVVPFFSCPNPFQNQSLFQWVNSLHVVAKVLEFQL